MLQFCHVGDCSQFGEHYIRLCHLVMEVACAQNSFVGKGGGKDTVCVALVDRGVHTQTSSKSLSTVYAYFEFCLIDFALKFHI